MSRFKKIFLFIPNIIVIGCVLFYKKLISPLLPDTCVFTPSCSSYTIEAVKKFGAVKGTAMGIKRLARCHPHAKNRFDPVPENIKGDYKWLI